jgi:hypothetical protein
MLNRFAAIGLAALCTIVLLPATAGAQLPPLADQVANAYGLASFGQIDAIRYTFNAQRPGGGVSRSWVWEPKTGQVTFEGKDKAGKPVTVGYRRADLSTQPDAVKKVIDPAFLNDQYWLVLPFHVVWDGAAVTDAGKQKLPLGGGSAEELVVKYASGGYSPGDTWDLYIGRGDRIVQMVYHRGGSAKPSTVTVRWTDYKKAGPLLVALDHRGNADGTPARVFFTNVSVKPAGSNTWLNAR